VTVSFKLQIGPAAVHQPLDEVLVGLKSKGIAPNLQTNFPMDRSELCSEARARTVLGPRQVCEGYGAPLNAATRPAQLPCGFDSHASAQATVITPVPE
jgi:hypothetical protein